MIGWLDARAAKEFGESLARFYAGKVPLDLKVTEKKFASRTGETLQKMELQIVQFKQNHKLNVYKTAQLGNAFKWALKDAGYDDAYIDRLTDWLVTKI